jgi:hypothetical protein
MANAVYPKFKEAQLSGSSGIAITSGDLRCILIDTGAYTYNAAHDFLDDVAAGRTATSGAMTTKTVTNGLLDADNVTFTAVSGAQSEALILYLHTGVESTSRLVAYIDTGVTGLPVTPNGGDIIVSWNASGIVQF